MKALLARFAADDKGVTATEYSLVAAGIGLAIASVVGQVGPISAACLRESSRGLRAARAAFRLRPRAN